MDGADLIRRLQQLMNEDSDSGWLDTRTSYDYFYEAAIEFVDRTGCLKSSQTITTVADTSSYDLNPDFLRLYAKNDSNEFIIKYYDGTNYSFPTLKDYEDVFYDNNTTSTTTPGNFAIIDGDLPDQISSTVTDDGATLGGQCRLKDTASDFSDVEPGASVNNTADGSTGIVISKTSSTILEVALFGGTDNDFTAGDAYIIQPNGRYQLILDPPPSTSGHTITVPYIQSPSPVYSDYGVYRIPNQYTAALIKYAFWLYKYRDREPNYGDAMYKFWIAQTGKYAASINAAVRPRNFTVNFKKRL